MALTLKEKLIENRTILGTMLSEIACANLARVLQTAGFEFIIVDCEHGYFDFSQLANIIAVGNGFGVPILVRVPRVEREYVTKVLDMGGDGLLVPMVNSRGDALKVVEYARYAPLGRRGLSTIRAHTGYNPPPLEEYLPAANARIVIFVQIETAQAVDNADAIAGVEGIDALMVGPNDLAADMESPGRLDTDMMFAAIDKVIAAAKKAGRSCGIIGSKIPYLRQCRDRGMTVFSCGSEVGMIVTAARAIVREFNI